MNKALIAVLAALAALTAIVAGCGGGGDSTTESLTKAQFIKRGDAICKKGTERSNSEAEAFAKENGFTLEKASTKQLEEAVTAVLVPNFNRQAKELDALGAPEGDEQQVEKIITSLESATDQIEKDPGLVLRGEVLRNASALAKDYGFEVCGEE